ncbi:MAG: hypothetical protein ACOC1F_00820 [Myxococcota bacterium]
MASSPRAFVGSAVLLTGLACGGSPASAPEAALPETASPAAAAADPEPQASAAAATGPAPESTPFACETLPAEAQPTPGCTEDACIHAFQAPPPEAPPEHASVPAGGHYVLDVVADGMAGRCAFDSPLQACKSKQPSMGWSDEVPCSVPWLHVQTGCGTAPSFIGPSDIRIDGCPRRVTIKPRQEPPGGSPWEVEQTFEPAYQLVPAGEGCGSCWMGSPD